MTNRIWRTMACVACALPVLAQVGGWKLPGGGWETLPAKHKLVLTLNRDWQDDVMVVNPDGSAVALGVDPGWHERPVHYDRTTDRVVIQRTRIADGLTRVYSVRTDGTGFMDLGGPSATKGAEFALAWYTSPITWVVINIQNGSDWDVHLVKVDGSDRRALMSTSKNEKAVASLGERVIIEHDYSPTDIDLYAAAFDGSSLSALATSGDAEHWIAGVEGLPAGGPAILYSRVQSGIPQIWTASAAGDGNRAISPSGLPQTNAMPLWKRVVFNENHGGQEDLFTVDLESFEHRTLADDPLRNEVAWQVTEPTGLSTTGYVVFTSGIPGSSSDWVVRRKWDGSDEPVLLMSDPTLHALIRNVDKDLLLGQSTLGGNQDLFSLRVGTGDITYLLASGLWEGYGIADRFGTLGRIRTSSPTFPWGYEENVVRLEGNGPSLTNLAVRPGFDERCLFSDGLRWLFIRSRDGEGWELYDTDYSGNGERTYTWLSGSRLYGGSARLTAPPKLFRSL